MDKSKFLRRLNKIEQHYGNRLNKRYFLGVDINETPEEALQRFQEAHPRASAANTMFFQWGHPDDTERLSHGVTASAQQPEMTEEKTLPPDLKSSDRKGKKDRKWKKK